MPVPTIETPRLTLRPFRADDGPALFAYSSVPEFSQFLSYPPLASLEEVQTILENLLMADDPYHFAWALTLRGQPTVVGSMQLIRDEPDTMSVYYDLTYTLHNMGYTTEALRAVLDWCLQQLPEVTWFVGDTTSSNIGSQRVMEKCGFVRYKRERVQWEQSPASAKVIVFRADRATIARMS